MPQMLVDRSGLPVCLGTELGRGGEGAVFEVSGRPESVAKIYLKQPGPEIAAKLNAMSGSNTAAMAKLAAWPTDLVLNGHKVVGFLMPRVVGFRPAFELYGPKLRLQRFPKADWRFLIRASANTARAFSAVHEARQVLGDVNHGNLVIGQDATVRLIDCDSFQISVGSRTWFCEVGVPTHQPPEMQGLPSYAGVTRTANHDAFGLAVLIFQMLCMARHPYSGRWLGLGEPPTMEEAIRQFLYAYSDEQRPRKLRPPHGSLPIEALGSTIGGLFDRAFLCGGVTQGARPTAARWVSALDELANSLKACSVRPAHHFLSTLPGCPWCELEGKSGVLLFPVSFVPGTEGADGFLLLWQQVQAVVLPGPRDRMPYPPGARPSRESKLAGRKRATALAIVTSLTCATVFYAVQMSLSGSLETDLLLFAVSFLLVTVVIIHLGFGRAFKSTRASYKRKWRTLQSEWLSTSNSEAPATVLRSLAPLKSTYDALLADRNEKLQMLQRNRQTSQMRDYLDRFRIAGAGIRGVGDAKSSVLQSYGIETACDIIESKILQIPGFGPKTVASLVAWRNAHASRFRFDPSKPVSANEVGLIENTFAMKRRELEKQLSIGLSSLKNAVANEVQTRKSLSMRHAELAPVYAQVMADSKAALFYL